LFKNRILVDVSAPLALEIDAFIGGMRVKLPTRMHFLNTRTSLASTRMHFLNTRTSLASTRMRFLNTRTVAAPTKAVAAPTKAVAALTRMAAAPTRTLFLNRTRMRRAG